MKILVIDDDKVMRTAIRKELEKKDLEIIEAECGKKAIKALLLNDDIGLITLDVQMPDMNGFEVLHKIRTEKLSENFNNKIPVIFVTANDTLEDRIRGFELGATEFVVKSRIRDELFVKVMRIVEPDNEFMGTHALVVDDSIFSRNIVSSLLSAKGVKVCTASNGIEGIEILKDPVNSIDFIISDLMMDKMDGFEFSKYVRINLGMSQIPLIILSAVSERSLLIDLFKIGITDYLMKPFMKEEFLARIKVHLQRIEDNRIMKKQYDEKQQAVKQLKETQEEILKLERRNTTLAMGVTANHEINQPLMVIRGNCELLEEQLRNTLNEKQKDKIKKVFESIKRIEEILTQLKKIEEVNFTQYSNITKMINLRKTSENIRKDDD
ncbi:MAG: response regulator [Candidatus Cloacimonetes bacterium]|nr:response regulator [Candidatus Cloacimonadota bacterium]